jgi:hypothetical protein
LIGNQSATGGKLLVDYLSIDSLPSEPIIDSIPFDKVDICVLDLWQPTDELLKRLEPTYELVKKY